MLETEKADYAKRDESMNAQITCELATIAFYPFFVLTRAFKSASPRKSRAPEKNPIVEWTVSLFFFLICGY